MGAEATEELLDRRLLVQRAPVRAIGRHRVVWRYRPIINQWTWVSGSNALNDTGNYPAQTCVFSDSNYPDARFENPTPAVAGGSCARAFWMFGGSASARNAPNALWLFRTDSMQWALMSGGSVSGVGIFGTKGIPSPANRPSARTGHCSWVDKSNNLWVFGGSTGLGNTNDLWRFVPDSSCINLRALFQGHAAPPDTSLCLGDTSSMYIGTHTSVVYSPAAGVSPTVIHPGLSFNPPLQQATRW